MLSHNHFFLIGSLELLQLGYSLVTGSIPTEIGSLTLLSKIVMNACKRMPSC